MSPAGPPQDHLGALQALGEDYAHTMLGKPRAARSSCSESGVWQARKRAQDRDQETRAPLRSVRWPHHAATVVRFSGGGDSDMEATWHPRGGCSVVVLGSVLALRERGSAARSARSRRTDARRSRSDPEKVTIGAALHKTDGDVELLKRVGSGVEGEPSARSTSAIPCDLVKGMLKAGLRSSSQLEDVIIVETPRARGTYPVLGRFSTGTCGDDVEPADAGRFFSLFPRLFFFFFFIFFYLLSYLPL
jgi:hypothetical protein